LLINSFANADSMGCSCTVCGQADVNASAATGSELDVPPGNGNPNVLDDDVGKDPFLPTGNVSDEAATASHCAGEDKTTNGMGVTDGADAFELLWHAGRYVEASRTLPQAKKAGDPPMAGHRLEDSRWERVRLIAERCSSLLAMAGRGASGYLGGGTAPAGAEWNYKVAGSNIQARMVQTCHVDFIKAVAGMAEVDTTGDTPFQQSSRLKKTTPAGFFGRSKGRGSGTGELQRNESCSSIISARRLTGFRHDIVEVRELSCKGSTPTDTVWQTITTDPNIHTKADDIFSSTIVDLLDEPARSVCVLLHPPPASMTLTPPRPKHGRSSFMQAMMLLEPMGELPDGNLLADGAAVQVRITRIIEIEVAYAVRKILQFMPTMVIRKIANKLATDEEAGINAYLQHSAVLTGTMESGPRAEFYERLRARWAKLPGR